MTGAPAASPGVVVVQAAAADGRAAVRMSEAGTAAAPLHGDAVAACDEEGDGTCPVRLAAWHCLLLRLNPAREPANGKARERLLTN